MKITITTDRRPWVDGAKTNKGDVVEVSDELGRQMIANEFAQRLPEETKKPAAKKKTAAKKNAKSN